MVSPGSVPHVRWMTTIDNYTLNANTEETSRWNAPIIHETHNSIPVRRRASTPSPTSRHPSTDSSFHDDFSESQDESPIRGRTINRLDSKRHGLFSRATARCRARPSSTYLASEILPSGISPQTSLNSSHVCHDHDESIIEPLPIHLINTNIPEILRSNAIDFAHKPSFTLASSPHLGSTSTFGLNLDRLGTASNLCPERHYSRASTSSSGVECETIRFGGHRDTFALLDLPSPYTYPRPAPELPLEVFKCLVQYVDWSTCLALRLTCQAWCGAITAVYRLSVAVRGAQMLPAEVVQAIYAYSEPKDFDAARRVCRGWMIAGLDATLLKVMLMRGGWWGGFVSDRQMARAQGEEWGLGGESKEWAMSKRLATECAMAGGRERGGMIDIGHVGFEHLGGGGDPSFTVSACGKFVLVVQECVVSVYSLPSFEDGDWIERADQLKPWTRTVCPARVLSVSMDTSCRRYAFAALLEGRVGMVCDLDFLGTTRKRNETISGSCAETVATYVDMDGDRRMEGVSSQSVHKSTSFGDVYKQEISDALQQSNIRQANSSSSLPTTTEESNTLPYHDQFPTILVETGPRSIYRFLCSATDPPLSVAICPSHCCVAFGCFGGIELHWVDALTTHDLIRWFPLTAPSDFLYFLPARLGIDNAKQLRLISSPGYEGQQGALRSRSFGHDRYDGGHMEATHGTHEAQNLPGEIEHYRAVPLSDGEMVLFTDPKTRLLCLGTDTSLSGPTKLERRFVFDGPSGVTPTTYTAGGALSWGVRVVVGYGKRVWLFNVPPDVLDWERKNRIKSYEDFETEWMGQPMRIAGVNVGCIEGLVDIAVSSSGGGLTVWGFSADGVVRTWQLDGGWQRGSRKKVILGSGAVIDVEDADGDVIMRDAPPLTVPDYDGTSSLLTDRPPAVVVMSYSDGQATSPKHLVEMDHATELGCEDEGYWSDTASGPGLGSFAIHDPSLRERWRLDEAGWDCDVDRLDAGANTSEIGVIDTMEILEMSRLECEVL